MKKFLIFLGFGAALLSCHSAFNLAFNSAVRAENVTTIRPETVLGVVTADWNQDGRFDRAILIEAKPTETDLLIYLSDAQGNMHLAIAKKNIAWRGALWGTQPTLQTDRAGSLELISGNEAIGRGRWTQKLTLADRDGAFAIVGYTYTSRDTLDLSHKLHCEINYLTGNGSKNGRSFKVSATLVALESWTNRYATNQCFRGFEF